jgi:hypothetical protein
MADFIKGLALCEQFFIDAAKPILDEYFPVLQYTAGLIGFGSDVLGYDDVTSTDHMWGPRFYLFLKDDDISVKQHIENVFAKKLPYTYKGYSVNFSAPDPGNNSVRCAEFIDSGDVSPLISIQTFGQFLENYLGICDLSRINHLDWLTFSEHKLLALTSGKLFIDMLNITKKLDLIRFYPHNVRLYLIASNWSLIAEEQAFVKRCSECGDEVGSILVCARIADRLMRLCFLYTNRYAPYSKWFGTAFLKLSIDNAIKDKIYAALSSNNITDRENNIVSAQVLVGELHNKCGLTNYVDVSVQKYFGRDIKVIFADRFAEAVMAKLQNTPFKNMPLIGTLSQVGNYTAITDNSCYIERIKALYSE